MLSEAIQQINFTGNQPQDGDENLTIFFITERKLAIFFKMNRGSFLMLSNDVATACVTICFYLIKYQHKMTQYNTLKVKLSNSHTNRLKWGIKLVFV